MMRSPAKVKWCMRSGSNKNNKGLSNNLYMETVVFEQKYCYLKKWKIRIYKIVVFLIKNIPLCKILLIDL